MGIITIANAKIEGKSYWRTTVSNGAHGEHLYHNCAQTLSFTIDDEQHTIEYQNGHGFEYNDYSYATNTFQVYTDNTAGKHADVINHFAGWGAEDVDQSEVDDYNDDEGTSYMLDDVIAIINLIDDNKPMPTCCDFSDDLDDYEKEFYSDPDATRYTPKIMPEGWDLERY